MIEAKLMYCPVCNVQILIKDNSVAENSKCPLCTDTLLLPAIKSIIEPLRKLREFLMIIEYSNGSLVVKRKYDSLVIYQNTDNFDLKNRMN